MNGIRLITALFLLMVHLVHAASIPQPYGPGSISGNHIGMVHATSIPQPYGPVFNIIPFCYDIGEPYRPYVESCFKCDDCKKGYRLSPKTCVYHRQFRPNN
ncbi:unnamed protein product [Meganyctiphanes norvegica]|uniref:Uncharacterized protein n=1 Tax=Meganyctiphanes norvegica TaxID=48144 RepID=A0AAV2PS68_MEGNR